MSKNIVDGSRSVMAILVAATGLLVAGCESSGDVDYSVGMSVGYGYYPYGGYYGYPGYPVYGGPPIVVTPPPGGRPDGNRPTTLPSGPGSGMSPSRPPSAQPRPAPSMSMSRPTPRPMGGGGRRR